tara:strand:+ start:53539 stop:53910 length:372 start_codon:yes stop_codon:yes gene_type:complete
MTEELNEDQDAQLAVLMSEGGLLDEVETLIRDTAASLLESGASDLNRFAARLSGQLVYAQTVGNANIVASVKRQARLLAEVQRLRFSEAQWDTFYSVVSAGTGIAVRVATNIILAGAAGIKAS